MSEAVPPCPRYSFAQGLGPVPSLLLLLGSPARDLFARERGSPSVTQEILSGLFENIGYGHLIKLWTDENRAKISDLCIFDIFDGIVGCCNNVPKISFQSDDSVLFQVDTSDQSQLLKKTDCWHPGILFSPIIDRVINERPF